jgi:hypothetical protein
MVARSGIILQDSVFAMRSSMTAMVSFITTMEPHVNQDHTAEAEISVTWRAVVNRPLHPQRLENHRTKEGKAGPNRRGVKLVWVR